MLARAEMLIAEGKLKAAGTLYNAAAALLDNGGGRENEVGIWLRAGQANLLLLSEQHAEAVQLFQEALELARKLHGEAHPATAVCLANYGESLMAERPAEAAPFIDQAIAMLETANPTGDYTPAFISAVLSSVRALKAQLSETDSAGETATDADASGDSVSSR
jgi:tetratricopeptide (TPR) repeat protein